MRDHGHRVPRPVSCRKPSAPPRSPASPPTAASPSISRRTRSTSSTRPKTRSIASTQTAAPRTSAALGSNAIDGEGSGDETPQVGLSIPSSRKESQIAIDESGTATDGDIYVAGGSAHRVDIFSSEGEYKGQLTEYSGGALGETCGVAVDGSGNVYVGDYSHGVHVYEPAANPPVNGDNTATFTTAANPCTMAAGTGATEGFLFVDRYNGELLKLDAATGEVKYTLASGASTVSVDPSSGHIFSARNTGGSSTIDEYDASGASEASLVSSFKPGGTAEGVAANGASEEVYVSRSGTENVEVYGATKVIPDVDHRSTHLQHRRAGPPSPARSTPTGSN